MTQKLLNLLRAACEGSGDSGDVMTASKRVQYGYFEQAIRAFCREGFREAGKGLFAKAPGWAPRESAPVRLGELFQSMQDAGGTALYAGIVGHHPLHYGVTLLNDGRLSEAREEFDSALRMNPRVDYVYYALAARFAFLAT